MISAKAAAYAASAMLREQARKGPGWCDEHNINHSWVDGPVLTSNPPIQTRRCVNCGKTQMNKPATWEDWP